MSAAPWTDRFPALGGLDAGSRQALEAAARIVRLPAGTRIFGPGQTPQSYVLLLSGDIRVSETSESGREIVLYRVLPGESCALTTVCLLGDENYRAEAVAETDSEAVAIPRSTFDDLLTRSPEFRRFVFAAFSRRISDLMALVDEIAFQRMDVRLAAKLIELAGKGETIPATHQQLAAELGTAREVVSRILNELQRRGLVQSGRGSLTIVDRAGLEKVAAAA